MNFRIKALLLTSLAVLTSCDLLLGPLSPISMQQKMEKGWVFQDLFTLSLSNTISNSGQGRYSMEFSVHEGNLMGFFGYTINSYNNGINYYYFMTGSFNNQSAQIHTALNTTPPNKAFTAWFKDDSWMGAWRNNMYTGFTIVSNGVTSDLQPFGLGADFNIYELADPDTLLLKNGDSFMNSNNLIGTSLINTNISNQLMTFNASISRIDVLNGAQNQSRKILLDLTVSNMSNITYSYQIFDLDSRTTLLDKPLIRSDTGGSTPVFVDMGANGVFSFYYGQVSKYNQSTRSFEEVGDFDSSGIDFWNIGVTANSRYVFLMSSPSKYSSYTGEPYATIVTFDSLNNTVSRSSIKLTNSLPDCVSMYYSTNDNTLYAGFLEYLSSGQIKVYYAKNKIN